jgi:hypothetical protein
MKLSLRGLSETPVSILFFTYDLSKSLTVLLHAASAQGKYQQRKHYQSIQGPEKQSDFSPAGRFLNPLNHR